MPESFSFVSLVSSASRLFQNTRNYFSSSSAESSQSYTFEPSIYGLDPNIDEIQTDEIDDGFNAKGLSKSFGFKQLFLTAAIVGSMGNRNSFRFGMSALFAAPVAAYPTISDLIPTQYVQPGQLFDYEIDLNWIFSDSNLSMTFGEVVMSNGDSLPSWLNANPPKLFGRSYIDQGGAFDIEGSIAYVANGNLLAFDISDRTRKVLIGEFEGEGIVFVAVDDGIAHLALNNGADNTYVSVNVTNPRAMYKLSSCSLNSVGNMYELAANAGKAYLATSFGLYVIEQNQGVPKLSGPFPFGTYAPFGVNSLTFEKDMVYLSASHGGVYFFNETAGNLTYVLDTPGEVIDVLAASNHLFVVDYPFGVRVVDLNTYNVIANYTTPTDATMLAMTTDNVLFVRTLATTVGTTVVMTVYVLDVSNRTHPILLNVFNTTNLLSYILAVNDTLYAPGLSFFNAQNKSNIVSALEPDLPVSAVAADGDIIYVVEDSYIAIRKISNFESDELLARFAIPNRPNSIAVVNNWLLVPNENAELLLVDVSDPGNPRVDNNLPSLSFITNVMTADNRAVAVSQGAQSFYLLDFSNSTSPILYGPYFLSHITRAVIMGENLFATGDNVAVFDISNFTNPIQIDDLPYAGGVIDGHDNFILLGSTQPSLLALLNATNTSQPSLEAFHNDPTTSSYTPTYVYDVIYRNRLIYTASGWGFQIYNHSSNGNLTLLHDYHLFPDSPTLYATQIDLVANRLYIVAAETGLHIFNLGRVHVSGVVPQNASGSYEVEISATNQNGEWISTNLKIVIGSPSNVTFSSAQTALSNSREAQTDSSSDTQRSQSSDSSTQTSMNSITTQTSATESTQRSFLTVAASSDAIYVDESGGIKIPAGYLSIQTNLPPDQVMITGSITLDYPYSLNEADLSVMTLASIITAEGMFIPLELQGVSCGSYSGELNLHIVAGDQQQDVSMSLIFEGTTCTASPRSRGRDPFGIEYGIALAASARGFFAIGTGIEQGVSAVVEHLPARLRPF